MRTGRLGDTILSAVGSGDVSLPVSASRGVLARDVEHALHEAVAFGISLLDVAPDRDSEKLAGEVVRAERARDRVVIATRVPVLPALELRAGAPRRDVLHERLPPLYLQEHVETALRATRLDALPLVQLPLNPGWLTSRAWPELVGTCARLIREGKVLAWGALLDEPGDDDAPALIAEPWLAAMSVEFHLCDRRAAPLFAAANQRNLAILARHPLAGGALAGSFGPGVRLPPRDARNALDPAALERIAVAVASLGALVKHEPPAARSCEAAREAGERARRERPEQIVCDSVAELALRFAIDRAGIALPRLHRPGHVLAAVAAAAAPPLPDELAARAEQIFDAPR